jgi:hypothetical protein
VGALGVLSPAVTGWVTATRSAAQLGHAKNSLTLDVYGEVLMR